MAASSGVGVVDLHKSFGATPVLRNVSLTVAPGEFVSLVGPSGCGKTTLMRVIAGLEAPTSGRVEIDGQDVTGVRASDRNVAMVFQNYALYPHLTVYGNIAVPLVMRRLSGLERTPLVGRLVPGTRDRRAQIARDVREAATLLKLDQLLERKPGQLSGGQRQRVALGRAIVRNPDVFLMDEPLSNLDAALRVETRKEIVDIHRRVGAPTLYVTHDQSEAMTMSDRVAVMMAGEIVQIATPQVIYADPNDLRVATFIGSPSINTFAVSIAGDGALTFAGRPTGMATPLRGAATLAVRPEHIVLHASGWPARARHVEFLGESILIHTDLEATGEPAIVRLAATDAPSIERGADVRLAFVPGRELLFDAAGRRAPIERGRALAPDLAAPVLRSVMHG
jgi:multiple sugar transport system ATP-binding protein